MPVQKKPYMHVWLSCLCRKVTSSGSESCTFFLILLLSALLRAEANYHRQLEGEGTLSSPGFPASCCQPATYTIGTALSAQPGYIRLTFSDLDLPPGSKLELYDGSSAQKNLLFASQPEIRKGVWTRPAIAARVKGGSIHIVFTPANYTGSQYVGFKASFWETNSPPEHWYDKPIPDVCTPLVSTLSGERVSQKTIQLSIYTGRTIDCVWQLKPPGLVENDTLMASNVKVYARIGTLSFTGYLDVKLGTSSEGELLEEVFLPPSVGVSALGQAVQGYTSSRGLYIHLSMLNQGTGIFDFTYGILHQQPNLMNTDKHSCYFGGAGFLCRSANESWCIPDSHKCNNIQNCVNGEDEQCGTELPSPLPPPLSSGPVSTPAASLFNPGITPPTKGCGSEKYMCKDGTCQKSCGNVGSVCLDLHFAGKSVWCPDVGCVDRAYAGWECLYFCGKCASDNTCKVDNSCPGICNYPRRTCSDGSCIPIYKTCPADGCGWYKQKCDDGRCISSSSSCSVTDCSYSQTLCSDGSKCIYESDKCDTYSDCNDGSDETGCPGRTWMKGKYWLIIPFAILCILALVYKSVRDKRRSRSPGTASPPGQTTATGTTAERRVVGNRTAYHSIVSRNINPGPPSYTGTHLHPAGSTHTPSQERSQLMSGGSSRSPSAHSAPSPASEDGFEDSSPGPDILAASAPPPPAYDEVVSDQVTYRPPSDTDPPPPSYDSVRPPIV